MYKYTVIFSFYTTQQGDTQKYSGISASSPEEAINKAKILLSDQFPIDATKAHTIDCIRNQDH